VIGHDLKPSTYASVYPVRIFLYQTKIIKCFAYKVYGILVTSASLDIHKSVHNYKLKISQMEYHNVKLGYLSYRSKIELKGQELR
jgi:hypothetical protein